ncbi:MAG: hypothetical protein EPO24_10890 [Bacteroidetes bacterium]|nr:MAG: hypothetical protein EPO24_10890 [Bacteroidota bacterium]
MPKLKEKIVLGIKTEGTQGTAVVPGATDFLLAEDVKVKIGAEKNERNANRSTLDQLAHVIGKRWIELTFKTEIKTNGSANAGSGQIYTPLGAALQACGFSETATPSTNVTYAPISSSPGAGFYGPAKSCTIEAYLDNIKFVVAGCIGNFKVSLEAGKIGYYEFSFKGKYSGPADASPGTQTYVATLPPIVESASFTTHGFAAVLSKFEWSPNNVIAERPDVNSAGSILGFMLTGRKPNGSFDPEIETLSSHDFVSRVIAGTEGQVTITVGGTNGNKTTFTFPKAQYVDADHGDRSGILTYQVPLRFNQNSGDDFVSIVQS